MQYGAKLASKNRISVTIESKSKKVTHFGVVMFAIPVQRLCTPTFDVQRTLFDFIFLFYTLY